MLRDEGIVGGHRYLVALIAVTWVLFGTAEARAAGFCESEVVRDYAKVLKRLPPRPSPPVDEHLEFAPARVFLGRSGFGPLQVGPGERGFRLSFSPYSEGNSASRRLGWRVTSRLAKLDRRGRPLGTLQTIEKRVKRVPAGNGLDFSFDIPGKPALYRVEIVFENGRGERLGRFGEYFRVLRPSLDFDFFLAGTTFRRGEIVRAWLANRGAAYFSFGLGQTIEYKNGDTWTPVKFSSGIVPAIGLGIGPGVKTSCWSTAIPPEAALGTYRFAKTVEHSTAPPFGRGTSLDLSAEFTVVE